MVSARFGFWETISVAFDVSDLIPGVLRVQPASVRQGLTREGMMPKSKFGQVVMLPFCSGLRR
jgi:hypothetical protein